jgi:hypothetical protein
MEMCKSSELAGEETCVLLECCAFLKNALLSFQCSVRELELDNITASELYPLMEKLRKNVSQRKEDMYLGEEMRMLSKFDEKSSISV